MDNKDYFPYIKNKYKRLDEEVASYAIIDSLLILSDEIAVGRNVNFKGALNLYKNWKYKRLKLTRDSDFSIFGIPLDKFKEDTIELISNLEHDIYSFVFKGSKNLTIKSNGYNGVKLLIDVIVGGVKVSKISCDITIEELLNNDGVILKNGIRIYTIERTLADKFTSLIVHGYKNTRHKDMIDLKVLYKISNNELLNELIEKLFVPRKITPDMYDDFKKNYNSYPIIKDNLVEDIVSKIINKIQPHK